MSAPKHNTRQPKVTYGRAFKIACAIEALKEGLTTASGLAARNLQARVRRLEAKITPPKRQRAIDDRRPIVARMLHDIQRHGAPSNLTRFIKQLRDDGVLNMTRFGKQYTVSFTKARNILRAQFGIQGKRGRKPGMLK